MIIAGGVKIDLSPIKTVSQRGVESRREGSAPGEQSLMYFMQVGYGPRLRQSYSTLPKNSNIESVYNVQVLSF